MQIGKNIQTFAFGSKEKDSIVNASLKLLEILCKIDDFKSFQIDQFLFQYFDDNKKITNDLPSDK